MMAVIGTGWWWKLVMIEVDEARVTTTYNLESVPQIMCLKPLIRVGRDRSGAAK